MDNPAVEMATQPPLILVVDDSRAMRESLGAILREADYRVALAENGVQGLAEARKLSPDLILSDLEMPEATGFELLAAVRSDAALALVPFVMITGVSDRSSTRRAMELGADDYLTKPFVPDEVLAIVASRLSKQRNWRDATHALAQTLSHGMMGVLPHEFRTPLNMILGFSELMGVLAKKGLTPEQTAEFADAIHRAGKTLLGHTTRFLTLLEYQGTPTTGGRTGTTQCVLDAGWVSSLMDDLLAQQLPKSRVSAKIDIAPIGLDCRPDVLRTLVKELISNAIKFALADSVVNVRGAPEGDGYRLDIEDTGVAFPLHRLRDIGAFVQFDRDRMEQQGLGIGLSIVNQAMRFCHARFRIDNLPGSVVRVSIHFQLPAPVAAGS